MSAPGGPTLLAPGSRDRTQRCDAYCDTALCERCRRLRDRAWRLFVAGVDLCILEGRLQIGRPRLCVLLEEARIAREVHEVVIADRVSVDVLQAAAARWLAADPARTYTEMARTAGFSGTTHLLRAIGIKFHNARTVRGRSYPMTFVRDMSRPRAEALLCALGEDPERLLA